MGPLGCPLCCRQHFPSVEGLHDHLLYYTYRPLQCVVCNVRLAGIHQFTHHLQEHISDGVVLGLHSNIPPEPDTHRPLSHTSHPSLLYKTGSTHQISSSQESFILPQSSLCENSQTCHTSSSLSHTPNSSLYKNDPGYTSSPISHTPNSSVYKNGPEYQTSSSLSRVSDTVTHKTGSVCQTSDPISQTSNLHKNDTVTRASDTVLHSHNSQLQITEPFLHKSGIFSQSSDKGGLHKAGAAPVTPLSTAGSSGCNSRLSFPATLESTAGPSGCNSRLPFSQSSDKGELHKTDVVPATLESTAGLSGCNSRLPISHTLLSTSGPSGCNSRLPITSVHSSESTPSLLTTTDPHSLDFIPHLSYTDAGNSSGSTSHPPSVGSHFSSSTSWHTSTVLPGGGDMPKIPSDLASSSTSQQATSTAPKNTSQDSQIPTAMSHPALPVVIETPSGGKGEGESGSGRASHGNTRVIQESTETVLCAYCCETCGEKVVGKDAYISHIRMHSQEQEKAQPQSQVQVIQESDALFTPNSKPHSQFIHHSVYSMPHSQYTLDSPHSQYAATPDTPNTQVQPQYTSDSLYPPPHSENPSTSDGSHPLLHSEYTGTFDSPHPQPHSHCNAILDSPHPQPHSNCNAILDSPHPQPHSQYTTNSPCHDYQLTPCSPHPKSSFPAGHSDTLSSPLGGTTSTPGHISKVTNTVNESANLPECLSGNRDESDAGNQLLKLREWQLGKLGKNLRRHKISFGKSPGISELSPLSGKVASVGSPCGSGDPGSVLDRMPPSQDSLSSFTDGKPSSIDVYSQTQPSCYTDSPSSDVNLLSVGQSDPKFHPKFANTEQDEVSTFDEPDPYSPTPSESPPINENLHNVNIFSTEEPEPSLSYPENSSDPNSSTPHRSEPQAQSPISPTADPGCLHELEVNTTTNQDTSTLLYYYQNSEQAENTVVTCTNQNSLLADTDISQTIAETFIKSCNNNELPIDATLPGEFDNSANTSQQNTQSVVSSGESSEKPWLTQHQSVKYLELHSASTLPSDIKDTQHRQTETPLSHSLVILYSGCHTEGKLQPSFPSSNNATTPENHESENHIPTVANVESSNYIQILSTDKVNENETLCERTSEQNTLQECGSPNQNVILHADKQIMSDLQDLSISGDSQDGDSPVQKSVQNLPYLHKKFHHDQDRKVGLVSNQSADVSRYIHSYQSLLVNRLNGTLSKNIQFPSSICANKEVSKKQEKSTTTNQAQVAAPQPPNKPKEYLCEVCGEVCNGRSAYKTHYRTHEIKGQKNFTCRYCEQKFFRKCTKDLHEMHHKSKCGYRCEQCLKVFSKHYKLQRHKQEVHATKKTFVCLECSRGFSTERRLQEHLQVHQNEKKHKCSQCDHSCHTATGLRTHVLERHSAGNFKHVCDVCGESFAKKYGLFRHKKRKHEAQQLSCEICPKKFSCNEDLFQHIKCHDNDQSIKCNTCEKTFTNMWGLQRHAESHQPNRQFKCKKCPLQFTRKDSLKMHMRVHTQRRLHTCHCGKRFMRKSHLKEHEDSHSEVPRYSCQICHRAFKFKGSLRNHSCNKSGESVPPDSGEPQISEYATGSDEGNGSSKDCVE